VKSAYMAEGKRSLSISERLARVYLREPWWAEFWSGVMGIGWAIALHFGDDTLSQSSPNTFSSLVQIASGRFWGWYCLVLGIAQIVSLALNYKPARWTCAAGMSWFPCMAVMSMLMSDSLVPHISVYGGWACINLFSVFRLLHRAS